MSNGNRKRERMAFTSTAQVQRTWGVIDRLARRAAPRAGVSESTQRDLHRAVCAFHHKLMDATRDLPDIEQPTVGEPEKPGVNVGRGDWSGFSQDELVDVIGREDVRSVMDAVLKTTSLLRALQQETKRQKRFLFRGQTDIRWAVIPRLGRALSKTAAAALTFLTDRGQTVTLDREKQALDEFREAWKMGNIPGVDDLDRQQTLDREDAAWWF